MTYDPISAQITWAVITSFLLQKAKAWGRIPFVTFEENNLNRVVSIFLAAAVAGGINFTFNRQGSFLNGPGGALTISGLSLTNILHFISSAVQQYVLQHTAYKGIIAPPLPGKVQEIVRANGHGKVVISIPDIKDKGEMT